MAIPLSFLPDASAELGACRCGHGVEEHTDRGPCEHGWEGEIAGCTCERYRPRMHLRVIEPREASDERAGEAEALQGDLHLDLRPGPRPARRDGDEDEGRGLDADVAEQTDPSGAPPGGHGEGPERNLRKYSDRELEYWRKRSRRHHPTRARTQSIKRITKRELELGRLLYPYPDGIERPKTRAECAAVERPCPFVSCKWNLYLDVSRRTGAIKFNFPDLEPEDIAADGSCVLDVTDRGAATLEQTGALINTTRERIRQIEVMALRKIVEPARDVAGATFADDLTPAELARIASPIAMAPRVAVEEPAPEPPPIHPPAIAGTGGAMPKYDEDHEDEDRDEEQEETEDEDGPSASETELLSLLRERGALNGAVIREELGLEKWRCNKLLAELRDAGKLVMLGQKRGATWSLPNGEGHGKVAPPKKMTRSRSAPSRKPKRVARAPKPLAKAPRNGATLIEVLEHELAVAMGTRAEVDKRIGVLETAIAELG